MGQIEQGNASEKHERCLPEEEEYNGQQIKAAQANARTQSTSSIVCR